MVISEQFEQKMKKFICTNEVRQVKMKNTFYNLKKCIFYSVFF